MDVRLIKEAKARVTTLIAYRKHKKLMNDIEQKLVVLYARKYEYKNNKRVLLTKRRKIKLGKEIIDRIESPSVASDLRNQSKLV